MAGRAAEHDVDLAVPDLRCGSNLITCQISHRAGNHRTVREIEGMDRSMDGVNFHSSHHIEAGLLEAKAEAAGSGEEINSDGSSHGVNYRADMVRCRSEKRQPRSRSRGGAGRY